jgi:hypothetical protein
VLKLLESSTGPEGVTVQASDGGLFFLPNEDGDRLAIPRRGLYAAFRAVRDRAPCIVERETMEMLALPIIVPGLYDQSHIP